jgi:hypothetical protein
MSFENLVVHRAILHAVFKRRHDGSLVEPILSQQLTHLQPDAMDAFRERVVEAMGSDGQSMEMVISDTAANSGVEIAQSLLLCTSDASYATNSHKYPKKLSVVQVARGLPGGMVIVFSGAVGQNSYPFVGVIKAETQSGFRPEQTPGTLSAQFVTDLFLTPASKLYKIGVFICEGSVGDPLGSNWRAHIYDKEMTRSSRDGAARYFFETFLGCSIPIDSARLTKAFFENSREFIKGMPIDSAQKSDLLTSLYTYLKVDKTPTIAVSAFSTNYLPANSHDAYRQFMQDKRVPLTAIPKDISNIGAALRVRRLKFGNEIQFTAPPEAFDNTVEVESIKHMGADSVTETWTTITIKVPLSDQV